MYSSIILSEFISQNKSFEIVSPNPVIEPLAIDSLKIHKKELQIKIEFKMQQTLDILQNKLYNAEGLTFSIISHLPKPKTIEIFGDVNSTKITSYGDKKLFELNIHVKAVQDKDI